MLYAALTPLLPHFAHTLHLSKARRRPARRRLRGRRPRRRAAGRSRGRAPRRAARRARRPDADGARRASASPSPRASGRSSAARFLQGCGSGFTWAGAFAWLLAAAPRERRGEVIGTALGAAVFGALLGPVVGSCWRRCVGRDVVFTALAGLAVVLRRLDAAARADPAREPVAVAAMRAGAARHPCSSAGSC